MSLYLIDIQPLPVCLVSSKKEMVAFLIVARYMARKYLFLLPELNRDPYKKRNRVFR